MDLSWLSQVTADIELALVRGWLEWAHETKQKEFGPTPPEKAAIASLSPEYGCSDALIRMHWTLACPCMHEHARACVCGCACGYRVWLFRKIAVRVLSNNCFYGDLNWLLPPVY